MPSPLQIHDEPPAVSVPLRRHLLLAAIVLTCLAVYGSFVPMEFKSLSWDRAVEQFKRVPWLELGVYKRADLVANIVLFVPLGFFWLGMIDLDRRSRMPALLAMPVLAALLVALAVVVEFYQQWTVRRTVSINDMVAESIGAIIGMVLWMAAGRWLIARVRDVLSPGPAVSTRQQQMAVYLTRLRRFLLLYAIGFVLYNIQPLDIAASMASLKRKYDDGRILLTPFMSLRGSLFNALWQVGSDMLLFMPIGLLLRLGWHRPRSLVAAIFLCLLGACAIEFVQLFIFTRYVDTTDLFISTAGGAIGAWVGGRLLYRGEETLDAPSSSTASRLLIALGLCTIYTIALFLFSWQPFDFVSTREEFWQHVRAAINLPFSGHYVGTEFNALTKVVRDVMYMVPYGVAARWVWQGDRNLMVGRLLVVIIGLLLGIIIEAGQAATISRFADITSVIMNIIGTIMGWWMWGLITRKPPLLTHRN